MKVFKVTAKNLKLLMRSKTSMLVVVFGPLIIMLLVGFAFNNNSTSKLNIGYFAPDNSQLTATFVTALGENPNFVLVKYPSDSQCIDMIQQGKVHLCIIFPTDFKIDNNKSNELQFYVDQSRANFVYSVIDTVSDKISLTSTDLSYQMTNDLISVIDNTKRINEEKAARIAKIKTSVDDISKKVTAVQADLDKLDLTSGTVDFAPITSNYTALGKDVDALNADVKDYMNVAKTGSNFTGDLTARANDVDNSTDVLDDQYDSLDASLDLLSANINTLNSKLTQAKAATGKSADTLEQNVAALNQLKSSVDDLKALIETNNAQINALKVTSAQSIVNPIKTTIKPVSSKSGNLNFIFPYFVILIIVFIGIMLSSNLIIMEKTSKAYFRNFTTPTKDLTFVMSIFLTSFIVVALQLALILALAYLFLSTAIFSSLWMMILLIFAAISLFTLIGMIIGYAANSQEAAQMASISIGSAFIFLSNLILPLETMSPVLQQISRYNPYVLCSELFKKLTLFNSTFKEVYLDFVIILIYIIILFVLALLVEKASKIQFISKKPITKQLAKQKDKGIERYFKLKNGVLLMSPKDLLEELATMSDKEFETYVNKKKNDFESWLMMNGKQDLAEKVGGCSSRKEMMAVLGASKDKIDPIAAAGIDKIGKDAEKEKKDEKAKDDKKEEKSDKSKEDKPEKKKSEKKD